MEGKDWWKSKQLWFNVLIATGELAQNLAGAKIVDPQIALAVTLVGNALLRVITKEPIKL